MMKRTLKSVIVMSSDESDYYNAGQFSLSKLKKSKAAEEDFESSEDDNAKRWKGVSVEIQLQADRCNGVFIDTFLDEFWVKSSKMPYMHQQYDQRKSDQRNTDHKAVRHFEEFTEDDEILSEMLLFLYGGDTTKVDATKQLLNDITKDHADILEIMEFLDTNPVPKSRSAADIVRWKRWKFETCVIKDSWNNKRFESIILAQSELFIRESTEQSTEDAEIQSLMRRIFSTWFSLLSKMLSSVLNKQYKEENRPAVEYIPHGEYHDEVLIAQRFRSGEQVPIPVPHHQAKRYAGRPRYATFPEDVIQHYRVNVHPDAVLELKPSKHPACYLATLSCLIGSQSVNFKKAFKPPSPGRSSSIRSSASEKPERDWNLNMNERRTSDPDDEETAPKGNSELVRVKMMSQHLLELIALSVKNQKVLKKLKMRKQYNPESFLTTAGLMYFQNGIFLSKLESNLSDCVQTVNMDTEMEHASKGKYLIYPKVLNMWKGHWRLLMLYVLACAMGKYIIDDPVILE